MLVPHVKLVLSVSNPFGYVLPLAVPNTFVRGPALLINKLEAKSQTNSA